MIQTFTPNAADQSFRIGILPRRARRRDNFFDSHCGYTTAKILSVYLITISEKESWRCVLREAFDELLCRPDSGGVCGYIEMHDPPPVMQQYNEPVQDVESHSRHCEEINCGNLSSMIPQKAFSRLGKVAYEG
jgi:hypothetical protein